MPRTRAEYYSELARLVTPKGWKNKVGIKKRDGSFYTRKYIESGRGFDSKTLLSQASKAHDRAASRGVAKLPRDRFYPIDYFSKPGARKLPDRMVLVGKFKAKVTIYFEGGGHRTGVVVGSLPAFNQHDPATGGTRSIEDAVEGQIELVILARKYDWKDTRAHRAESPKPVDSVTIHNFNYKVRAYPSKTNPRKLETL